MVERDDRSISLAGSYLTWEDIEQKANELCSTRSKIVQMALENMFLSYGKIKGYISEFLNGIMFILIVVILLKVVFL